MNRALREVLKDVLAGWRDDLSPEWQALIGDRELGFDGVDLTLKLEAWEPVFPVRAGRTYLGAPKGAHVFHAFDGIEPGDVSVVVLGQDPYPCAAFSTGRAFEAGNVAAWRELEKMFSVSVRTYMQLIAAARTGDASYADSTGDWARLVGDIESGRIDMEPASRIADRWVGQGVLLLNSALTISRFAVEGDPHQLRGHLPLWRPLIVTVLERLAVRGKPMVFIGFGGQAAEALRMAGIFETGTRPGHADAKAACILREHPAAGDQVLALENPFTACNRLLSSMNVRPISW